MRQAALIGSSGDEFFHTSWSFIYILKTLHWKRIFPQGYIFQKKGAKKGIKKEKGKGEEKKGANKGKGGRKKGAKKGKRGRKRKKGRKGKK